jgi:hypothetical protein
MVDDRIRFVTANFSQLQGLRWIPLSFYLIALAASAAGQLWWLPGKDPHTEGRWLGVAFCVALIAAVGATSYYRRRYGAVAQFSRRGRNALVGLAVALFILLARFDLYLQGSIALAPFWVAAALVLVVRADGWVRRHFLLAALPWFIIAWVPPLHAEGITREVSYALGGAFALLVCGIGDHRLIARTFPTRLENGHEPRPGTL